MFQTRCSLEPLRQRVIDEYHKSSMHYLDNSSKMDAGFVSFFYCYDHYVNYKLNKCNDSTNVLILFSLKRQTRLTSV